MVSNTKGVATAVVTDNVDPEGLCRVKVRYPWQEDARESQWARLAVPMAGKNRGVMMVPDVGDEVLVAFEGEDVRRPYVIGSLWNASAKPPLAGAGGDQRLVRSRKGHRLLLDDGARGVVELAMDDGKRVTLDDRGVAVQDEKGNRFRIDTASGAIEITSAGALTIKAAAISIDASGTIDIKASGTLTLRGSLITIN